MTFALAEVVKNIKSAVAQINKYAKSSWFSQLLLLCLHNAMPHLLYWFHACIPFNIISISP